MSFDQMIDNWRMKVIPSNRAREMETSLGRKERKQTLVPLSRKLISKTIFKDFRHKSKTDSRILLSHVLSYRIINIKVHIQFSLPADVVFETNKVTAFTAIAGKYADLISTSEISALNLPTEAIYQAFPDIPKACRKKKC